MKLKVQFNKPTLRFDEDAIFEKDIYRNIFSFSTVNEDLIGLPSEKMKTKHHSIRVSMPKEIRLFWHLDDLSTYKVLFHFAKIAIEEKIKEGNLSNKEDYIISDEYSNNALSFNVSNLPDPFEESFIIEQDRGLSNEITNCLADFAQYIQSELRMSFWGKNINSKKRKWKARPEQHAKNLLQTFLNGRYGKNLYVFEELKSGAGKIDIFIVSPTNEKAVLELKMCGHGYSSTYAISGDIQLIHYMKHKQTEIGFLVIFDSRIRDFGKNFESEPTTQIETIIIDVRPKVITW